MKKQTKTITVIGLSLFLAGAVAFGLLELTITNYQNLAVPVAAALAALGGFMLILNAIIHPESVKIPNVKPPHIGGNHTTYTITAANVPGIINVNEWFIVELFKKDAKPLTKRQRVRGTLCCLLWLATALVYLPMSFYMDNFDVSWLMFFGAAFIHIILYGLLSIGERKEETQ